MYKALVASLQQQKEREREREQKRERERESKRERETLTLLLYINTPSTWQCKAVPCPCSSPLAACWVSYSVHHSPSLSQTIAVPPAFPCYRNRGRHWHYSATLEHRTDTSAVACSVVGITRKDRASYTCIAVGLQTWNTQGCTLVLLMIDIYRKAIN